MIKKIFPKFVWDIKTEINEIALTFDDGPIPELTPYILDLLKEHKRKATFFCVGENIKKYPHIAQRIISEGHAIGNHTYNHLKGTKTSLSKYVENVEMFDEIYMKVLKQNSPKVFRPPYGLVQKSQSKNLRNRGYKIIMWDLLSYDFDRSVDSARALKKITDKTSKGSVVLFHDNIKARQNLEYMLPRYLQTLDNKKIRSDYTFK